MKIAIPLVASVALLLAAGSSAYAQNLYGTNFDGSTTSPYTDATNYVSDPNVGNDLVGQGGWVGNDDPSVADAGDANYHGGLNAVQAGVAGTTGTGSSLSGKGGALFGEVLNAGGSGINVYPGASSVYVAHQFTLNAGGYSLNTDFVISTPATTGSVASGYGFGFRAGSGATSTNVFSVQFTRDPLVSGQDVISYQIGTGAASAPSPAIAVTLNGAFHLTLTVDRRTNVGSIAINGATVFSNLPISAALAGSSTQVAALQFINGTATPTGQGGFLGAGDDQLTFDNFATTVPEPSTYVMLGLGVVSLVGAAKYRRRPV